MYIKTYLVDGNVSDEIGTLMRKIGVKTGNWLTESEQQLQHPNNRVTNKKKWMKRTAQEVEYRCMYSLCVDPTS